MKKMLLLAVILFLAVPNLSAKGCFAYGGGFLLDFESSIECLGDSFEFKLTITDDSYNHYRVFNKTDYIEVATDAEMTFTFSTGDQIDLQIFNGSDRSRLYSGFPVQGEEQVLIINEYFSCYESTFNTNYYW